MNTPRILTTITITDAADAVLDLDHNWGVLPEHASEELLRDIQTILDRAAAFTIRSNNERTGAITTVAELLTHQSHLISAITGVPAADLHRALVTEDAVAVHRLRNVILALAIAAAAGHENSTATIDATVKAAPQLHFRTLSERRPFEDDEVFLARTCIAATFQPGNTSAGVYALVDAGLTPGETTSVTLDHFDDIEVPRSLVAPGNAHIKSRYIELDRFATFVLGRLTRESSERRHAHIDPLFYKQRKPKKKSTSPTSTSSRAKGPGTGAAAASTQSVINSILKSLGLWQKDTTASSITQWRVVTAGRTRGQDYAFVVSGRSTSAQMLEALKTQDAIQPPSARACRGFSVAGD